MSSTQAMVSITNEKQRISNSFVAPVFSYFEGDVTSVHSSHTSLHGTEKGSLRLSRSRNSQTSRQSEALIGSP